MKLTIREALRRQPRRLVIESVDLSLYIVSIELEGELALLVDESRKPLKTRNLLAMKELLTPLAAYPAVLRQRSAYDEMCGQPFLPADNTLEVPLDVRGQPLPRWEH